MHTGPLGVISWTLGSVLVELWEDGIFEGTPEGRRQQLWEHMSIEYSALGSSNRLTELPISLFYHGPNSYAAFTGKAGEAISLTFVLLEVCTEFNNGSPRGRHRLAVLDSLCRMMSLFRSSGNVLTTEAADTVLDLHDRFLMYYNWLTSFSAESDRMLYNLVTKHHNGCHIAYHARFLNPCVIWCMEFEDVVGTCIK